MDEEEEATERDTERDTEEKKREKQNLSSLVFLVFASSSGRFLSSSSLRSSLAPALKQQLFFASFTLSSLLSASSRVQVLFCSSLSFLLSFDYKTAAVSLVHFTQVVSPASL